MTKLCQYKDDGTFVAYQYQAKTTGRQFEQVAVPTKAEELAEFLNGLVKGSTQTSRDFDDRTDTEFGEVLTEQEAPKVTEAAKSFVPPALSETQQFYRQALLDVQAGKLELIQAIENAPFETIETIQRAITDRLLMLARTQRAAASGGAE